MRKVKFAVFAFVFFVFAFGANADVLGQGQRFFISPQYDGQSRTWVNATLRYVSEKVYFYVENDYWNSISEAVRSQNLSQIEDLAREFDTRIYPIETGFFGSEPNPGIDNDPRITVLLTPLIEHAGGYFDTTNEQSVAEVPNSNQREIIYINTNSLADKNKIYTFLDHEFQHLISFNQKEKLRGVSDDIWLNELRSEYASTLLGYNEIYEGSHLQRRIGALLGDPSDSLTEWKNLTADYGQIGLFGEYIAEHFSPQVIADTLKNKSAGFNSLAESLTANGYPGTFLDIYRDWLIANFLNDSVLDPKFSYSRSDLGGLHVSATQTITELGDNTVLAISDSIKDWQGRWYDISQLQSGAKNVLKIDFNSPSLASFYISYLVFGTDGKYLAYDFNPTPSSNALYIPNIGSDAGRIVLMPIKKDKLAGFSSNEPTIPFTISFERVASVPLAAAAPNPILTPISSVAVNNSQLEPGTYNLKPSFSGGSLLRARGDSKVYVINGSWRRHIINSRIFGFYPGLGFEKVTEVEPEVLYQYRESNLIRPDGSQRVYEVDPRGVRHWLNISGEQFTSSGRSWEAIFMVNSSELNYYSLGQSILK